MAKVSKRTIVKAHRIARRIKGKKGIRNPWAVGMARAKRSARKKR